MAKVPDAPKVIVFDDGKAPDALRTIGEVSKALGIAQHVLRYWEQQFPMLDPAKRSGRRYYRTGDIALLARIDRMVHHEGYTLRGARQAIEAAGARKTPAAVIPRGSFTDVDSDLSRIRTRLAEALAAG